MYKQSRAVRHNDGLGHNDSDADDAGDDDGHDYADEEDENDDPLLRAV